MGTRGFIAVLAAIAFVALLAYGLIAKEGAQVAVGEPAPSASLERLGGGREVSLADHRGEWVLLNFWASWCDPCREEAPALERFSREHAGITVIGIDVKDSTEAAQQFAREFDLTYELLHDGPGEQMDAYGIFALPESFLVDPDGKLTLIRRGVVDEAFLEQQVVPLVEADGGRG